MPDLLIQSINSGCWHLSIFWWLNIRRWFNEICSGWVCKEWQLRGYIFKQLLYYNDDLVFGWSAKSQLPVRSTLRLNLLICSRSGEMLLYHQNNMVTQLLLLGRLSDNFNLLSMLCTLGQKNKLRSSAISYSRPRYMRMHYFRINNDIHFQHCNNSRERIPLIKSSF